MTKSEAKMALIGLAEAWLKAEQDARERRIVSQAVRLLKPDAIRAFGKLQAARKARATLSRAEASMDHLRRELRRILPCPVCGIVGGNPLFRCTGEFGCALETLRYRASRLDTK